MAGEKQPEPGHRVPPTAGGQDELMADPPAGTPPGGLEGYRAGRKLRFALGFVVVASLGGAGWYVKHVRDVEEAERKAPKLPEYTLSEDVDDDARPKQLVWSDGVARLGLARQQPGVQEIVLPDRRLRLAPGHDIAQVKVDVQDGKTVKVAVLVGKIIELPPEDPPAPAALPATAP